MTPSEQIIKQVWQSVELRDAHGRQIKLRQLTALDTLRLLKAAGPHLAQNQPWLSLATLAYSVSEIDSVPVPIPATESQIEALVEKLGEDALTMIADYLDRNHGETPAAVAASAGN